MIDQPDILSPQGRRRRDEIGRLARHAARRRRRKRRVIPVVVVSAVVLMAAVEMFTFRPMPPTPRPPIARTQTTVAPKPAPSLPTESGITIALIKTES